MTTSAKRAEYLAVFSLVLSLLFFIITLLLGYWSRFFAVFALSWFILSSSLIWLVLLIQFHQRALAEQEKLDMSRLIKEQQSETIFEQQRAGMFNVAQKRLQLLEKWFLPVFSIIIAAYQITMGIILIRSLIAGEYVATNEPLICAVEAVTIAFICFLISRYATGMASQQKWRPLKAGGSIFVAIALLAISLAVALAFVHGHNLVLIRIVEWIIPVTLILIGVETAFNIILDIYRPRIKEQYNRTAFDSRLLGIINEPGGILRTAASAIDYQFGFQVSQTWFYKLLEKAIVPLVLFAAACLYLLSCIVVIGPDEKAVIERFGNPVKTEGSVKIFQPGLSFKLPWPVDIVYKYPTEKVVELAIGYKPKIDPKTGQAEKTPKLWGQQHYQEEYILLVAAEQTASSQSGDATPFNVIMAAVPVQYKVTDLNSFMYNYGKYTRDDGSTGYAAEKMLESICYHNLTKYAASAKIEVEDLSGPEQGLLGAGRTQAKKVLTERIQKQADQAGLGVEIVFIGLQGIHPPIEVAGAFQDVVGAIQQRQTKILKAQAKRAKLLNSLAGSAEYCDYLYDLTNQYKQANLQNDTIKAQQLSKRLDDAFEQATGSVYTKIRDAESYSFERARLAKARGQRFAGQLDAYLAAPEYFTHHLWLETFEKNLPDLRKIVIIADPSQYHIEQVDLTDQVLIDLPNPSDFGGTD